jgi:hypothetical protein
MWSPPLLALDSRVSRRNSLRIRKPTSPTMDGNGSSIADEDDDGAEWSVDASTAGRSRPSSVNATGGAATSTLSVAVASCA